MQTFVAEMKRDTQALWSRSGEHASLGLARTAVDSNALGEARMEAYAFVGGDAKGLENGETATTTGQSMLFDSSANSGAGAQGDSLHVADAWTEEDLAEACSQDEKLLKRIAQWEEALEEILLQAADEEAKTSVRMCRMEIQKLERKLRGERDDDADVSSEDTPAT